MGIGRFTSRLVGRLVLIGKYVQRSGGFSWVGGGFSRFGIEMGRVGKVLGWSVGW